jgi:hypothetical protein
VIANHPSLSRPRLDVPQVRQKKMHYMLPKIILSFPIPLASPVSHLLPKRWATKKAGGITQNNRKAQPKYLGVKRNHGEVLQRDQFQFCPHPSQLNFRLFYLEIFWFGNVARNFTQRMALESAAITPSLP